MDLNNVTGRIIGAAIVVHCEREYLSTAFAAGSYDRFSSVCSVFSVVNGYAKRVFPRGKFS